MKTQRYVIKKLFDHVNQTFPYDSSRRWYEVIGLCLKSQLETHEMRGKYVSCTNDPASFAAQEKKQGFKAKL